MSYNYVTVELDYSNPDPDGTAPEGNYLFVAVPGPVDTDTGVIQVPETQQGPLVNGQGSVSLLAMDNPTLTAFAWKAIVRVRGQQDVDAMVNVAHANGATQQFSSLVDAVLATGSDYASVATAAALAAEVTRAESVEANLQAEIAAGGGGGSAVTSVNGHTGVVVLAASDVSADASGSATAAQTAAETYAAGLVTAETSRAETAESANTSAVAAEVTRAETAEALKANLSALNAEVTRAQAAEAVNASAVTTEASRATSAEATNATAIANEITRAEGAESTNATAIANEVTRATAAEATKASSAALTAEISRAEAAEANLVPTSAVGANSGVASLNSSGKVPSTELPTSFPPSGAAGGDLAGSYPSPTVAKINGNALPASPVSIVPANPTAFASTAVEMLGIGGTVKFTPTGNGHVFVYITCIGTLGTSTTNLQLGARFGTGAAPANQAANTGTSFGSGSSDITQRINVSTAGLDYSFQQVLTLTPATQYWFDLAMMTPSLSNVGTVTNIVATFIELPT